ncbi:MAG: NERD domain-containing protein [Actinomycetota bacterium]|nr:NERD domain-containing protein [Actinomycetota bacterium]
MDDCFAVPTAPADTRRASLTDRVAGQAVMEHLLALQQDVPPRSAVARALGVSPLDEERAAWYRGALGEAAVGRLLEKLPEGWAVLHAVPVGKGDSDIDHVVIGPGGVFTINTKNHSGQKVWVAGRTFMVNGQKQPHLRNAGHEAQRASRLLSAAAGFDVHVVPVIAVVDPASLTMRERPEQVVVLTSSQLIRWLKKRPATLAPEQVRALLDVSVDPAAWHASPAPGREPAAVRSSFSALDLQVRHARRTRRALACGLLGAGGLAAVTSGPSLLTAFLTRLVT